MKRILTIALAATSLIGLGACGSDTKASISNITIPSDLSIPSIPSIPSDFSIPSDITMPAILTGDCQAIYAQMMGAMTQVLAPAGEGADLAKVFGDVAANVPAELKGDVAIMSGAMEKLAVVMKQYDNDPTNPEVTKAMGEIGTPEVQAASQRLNAYFEKTCPQS